MSWDDRSEAGGSGRSGRFGGSSGSGRSGAADGTREAGTTGGFGGPGGFSVPPPPGRPPAAPPGRADPLRAAAVALLNLSGLGLGYALIRRWGAMAVCWAMTGVLLLVALPADPDGVAGGAVVCYLVLLALAAAHGAFIGLRTGPARPPRSAVAVLVGLALLAAPVGGVVLYDQAREEATQQLLLDRLGEADRIVESAAGLPFGTAEPQFGKALATYRDLHEDHPGSRAAKRVPDRLDTYYKTVGAPYEAKDYCAAVAPLTYLRTVPDTIGRKQLGALADWPDDRLASSLYECGVSDLGRAGAAATGGGNLGELLLTFPGSPQAAKVVPAVSSTIDRTAAGLKGDDPCEANATLQTLRDQAAALSGTRAEVADDLAGSTGRADRYLRSGTYACGVDEYRNGDFDAALTTMNTFLSKYRTDGTDRTDKNRASAKKIAIAAEIAQDEPTAGKRLPTSASGGSVPVTIKNDSPDEVEVLYTGPVTGSVTLKGCGSCSRYASAVSASLSACKGGKDYPQKTISLPVGTTYFLHKSKSGPATASAADEARIQSGFVYTECAYVVESFGTGL
jgi:hypothetical protein